MGRRLLAAIIPLLVALLAGCGGGFTPSASATAPLFGRATLTVQWPAQSRLIPDASNSIACVITQGPTRITQKLLARPAGGGTATATFDTLPVGNLSITATAYPNADGTGTPQATATIPLVITANQTTSFSLTMASTIDHVEISPAGGQVNVGSTLQFTVAAKNAAGAVVLLAPAKISWSSTDPTVATVSSSGLVTGVKSGSISLSVTELESQKSASVTVTVGQAATPLLYDGFAYNAGEGVSGQNGGTGNWGGPWSEFGQGYTSSVIQSGSLSFGNLATSGNSVLTTSDFPVGHGRNFGLPKTFGTSGTTLYISFLVKPVDALDVGSPDSYFQLVFGNIGIGKDGPSDFYALESGAGVHVYSKVKAVTNQTAFLVVRFTFRDGRDTCDLWVNPTPGQPLPATPDVTKSDVDTGIPDDFNIGSSIRTVFDEIRFGTTWEQVSPVK